MSVLLQTGIQAETLLRPLAMTLCFPGRLEASSRTSQQNDSVMADGLLGACCYRPDRRTSPRTGRMIDAERACRRRSPCISGAPILGWEAKKQSNENAE
jgi:hypothetical protein